LRRLFLLPLLCSLALVVASGFLYRDLKSFSERALALPEEGVVVAVLPGQSMRTLAAQLAERGFLDRPAWYLEALARFEGSATKIKAGEYQVVSGTAPDNLLTLLVSGQEIQYPLTILEGWSFRDLMQRVRADPVLVQTLEALDGVQIMSRMGRAGLHPEGRFLPDTYHFPRGTSDQDFLERALRAMDRALAEEWEQRASNLPLDTPEQALILASIVEKETALAEERAEIAGVFLRRLRQGMRLQTDPTVIYGLGTAFDGNLTRRHLRSDTPYNTYTRDGLPPTPIALPSRAAIHATLHPRDGDAIYFVSRRDGSHQFSRTLAEHNAAVRRYQLGK
jgi:UPF0755 protein